ncbi:hypothetical protein FRB95_001613 [Tulasnella sp. JGI-2019a]|nr:hypothetical protein FRB95_001613 [Tulasnella sp. JGI-2019a]
MSSGFPGFFSDRGSSFLQSKSVFILRGKWELGETQGLTLIGPALVIWLKQEQAEPSQPTTARDHSTFQSPHLIHIPTTPSPPWFLLPLPFPIHLRHLKLTMSCVDHVPLFNWYSVSSPASTSSASSSTSNYTRQQQQHQHQFDSYTPATSVGSSTSSFLRQPKEEAMSPPASGQSMSQFPPQQQHQQALPPLSSLIPTVTSSPRRNASQRANQQAYYPSEARQRTVSHPSSMAVQTGHWSHPSVVVKEEAYQQQAIRPQQDISSALANFSIQTDHATNHPQPAVHTPPEAHRKRARIADFVAHNTCAMVCYLTFSGPRSASSTGQDEDTPMTDMERARLQFVPSVHFVEFMHLLLTTTQVSQSVIVLSLHYIYRLRMQNPQISTPEGSEMRLAVSALMLANKFLDDNTYTNKTWSDISKIELKEINRMEREFLLSVGCRLYVDQPTYESWLQLLNGLMIAKEKEYENYRRAMVERERRVAQWSPLGLEMAVSVDQVNRPVPAQHYHLHNNASARGSSYSQQPYPHQRARSTSPVAVANASSPYPFTFALPPMQQPHSNPFANNQNQHQRQTLPPATTPTRPQSNKRSAVDAFSPPTASQSLSLPPSKRPLSLDMGLIMSLGGPSSISAPVSSHTSSSLANAMQLPPTVADIVPRLQQTLSRISPTYRSGSYTIPPPPPLPTQVQQNLARTRSQESLERMQRSSGEYHQHQQAVEPTALVAPYRPDERLSAIPEYLTFNTLAASPSVSPTFEQQQQRSQLSQPQNQLPPIQFAHAPEGGATYYHHHQRKTVVKYQPQPRLQQHSSAYQYQLPPLQGPRFTFSAQQLQQQSQQPMTLAFTNPASTSSNFATNGQTRSARTSPIYASNGLHPFQPHPKTVSRSSSVTIVGSTPQHSSPYDAQYNQQSGVAAFANAGPPGYQWDHQQGQQPQQSNEERHPYGYSAQQQYHAQPQQQWGQY